MTLQKMTVCLVLAALLLSGCGGGGNGGGPKEAVVTVIASPNPATGESFTNDKGNRQIRWPYTLTFTESSGVGVTITTFDWEVKGDNGYTYNRTGQSLNSPISVPANGSTTSSGWTYTSATSGGQPVLETGTLKDTFYGTDDNGNSIERSVTITLR
jgi:hypothetical protein